MATLRNSPNINLRIVLFLTCVTLIISNPCALAHTDVTAEQTRDLIDSTNDLIVIDVREPSEYCDAIGHIPGALNYPLSSGVLEARYEELPMHSPILVVCRSGGRSNRAANFLDSKGFSMVYDMMGGMSAWIWETVPCKYRGGTGEPNDPYLIYTAEQMNEIGLHEEDWGKHFKLMTDIDLSTFTGTDFNIVGYYSNPFKGVFDGNGYTISNFSYTSLYKNRIGLFRHVNGEIRNTGMVNPHVDAGTGFNVGSLVGLITGGTIAGCYVEDGSVSGDHVVGGLVGHSREYSTITNCYSTASVFGDRNVGGLMGANHSSSVDMSYSIGAVTGSEQVGGLVGKNGAHYIENTTNKITNCYAICRVSGNDHIGGLVGRNSFYGTITNCYSRGSVLGNEWVGGLVGSNDGIKIADCYATGAVSGNKKVGGLVGFGWHATSSFWDIQTSSQRTGDNGTGKTTAKMQTAITFLEAGWDFVDEMENGTEDIWWILEGQSYPRLRWQYGLAFSPYPQNGAIDVIQPIILNWLPGGSGLYHEAYFGEDEEAVANATTKSKGIYRGQLPVEVTIYDPGKLELYKTYYWRIDEVNEADPNIFWKGNIWSFTTANFLVVDDFEGYNESIFDFWIDGWGTPTNGSTVSILSDIDPYFNPDLWGFNVPGVHGGEWSMACFYDNTTAKYSEATMTLVWPRNWTQDGVGVLYLWFNGDPNNAPEPMYVALTNVNGLTVVVYHDNPDAAQLDTWTEWNIYLQEFADQGVHLANVHSITLGFGNKNNPQADGSGLVFFDDIRLYRPNSQEPEP